MQTLLIVLRRKPRRTGSRIHSHLDIINTCVSLRLRVQNAVPAQPCVGKY